MSDPTVPFEGEPIGSRKSSTVSAKPISGTPVEGHYAKQIGSGEYARNSFIYITILWSFIIGSVTCAAVFFKSFIAPAVSINELLEVMKGVWSIFLPIITLALGYSFGKGR